MAKEQDGLFAQLKKIATCVHAFIKKMYGPASRVGNFDRVKKDDELDPDDEKIRDLNRTWREMLRDDPWMIALMAHVRLATTMMGVFFLLIWLGGLVLPSKHPMFNYVFAGVLATIPYWYWIGKWYGRIQDKVWAEFTKRFGKHFHRR